ncbi:MAG: 50S ribosomal protein L22 [Candidatus Andersenbacteria bacterium]|nr:50S ribosomal protein L22 [Candidatus Andersenbacteria bacterium]
MEIFATHKNARMSPQKLRALARILRGMPVNQAKAQLQFFPGKAAVIIREVLKSAIANATHNFSMIEKDLVVRDVIINQGFVMKRIMPVSRGMAHPILKRTAHVTVTVGAMDGTSKVLKGKKSEIATISAEEFAARGGQDEPHTHEEASDSEDKKTGKGNIKEVTEEVKKDKSMTAFGKTKMNQQGGDPKKTNRRRAPGANKAA